MNKVIITTSAEETRDLGKKFAAEIRGGAVICLEGDLGAGKTTFTQGLLEVLGAEGPYTSPTFVIMKNYEIKNSNKLPRLPGGRQAKKLKAVYHVDAYRIGPNDLPTLGWDELVNNLENIVIIEWPEKIEAAIPTKAVRIKFEWVSENERKISYNM